LLLLLLLPPPHVKLRTLQLSYYTLIIARKVTIIRATKSYFLFHVKQTNKHTLIVMIDLHKTHLLTRIPGDPDVYKIEHSGLISNSLF